MRGCSLSMSVAALANAIACQLSDEDLDIAAAVFNQLGDTLETISLERQYCCKNNNGEDD